jgi:hypothetical protein
MQDKYVQFQTTNPNLLQVTTISQNKIKKKAVTQGSNTSLLIVTVAFKPHFVYSLLMLMLIC